MDKRKEVNNVFFSILALFISFILSFTRGITFFFGGKLNKKSNVFFDFLDFIFRKWSKYFWIKPTLFKVTSFFGDLLNFILRRK